jgi:hypothetical protein
VRENAGIHHQKFVGRTRLATEHDPTEAHLGVDRENQLRKLGFADASIQSGAQLVELRILLLGHEWCEVQFVVDA